jgi:16S rRNA (cytidine1402-2'-O)-methyltransferase
MSPKSPSKESPASARAEPSEAGTGSKPARELAGLYIVATPIGNLADISLRAVTLLQEVDRVACEDTRVTRKLLAAHGIARPLVAYHDHNAESMRPRLIEAMKHGDSVALVSDAGTPLVSDPGFKLVQAAIEAGLPVVALPGASAALAGLVVSGLPSDRFFFAGFLPPKRAARRKDLAALAGVPATLIFYESGPRLAASLSDMAQVLGPRQAAVARELTKLFEQVRRGNLTALARQYHDEGPPKGEIVVVVAPPGAAAPTTEEELDARLAQVLETASLRDAVAQVAAELDLPRRRVYARALTLGQRDGGTS